MRVNRGSRAHDRVATADGILPGNEGRNYACARSCAALSIMDATLSS